MKKILRKFLSFATAVCVICSVLSVGTPLKLTVSAASESDLTFELNGDGKSYYVASCNRSASGDLIIPSTYNSLPVRGIDDRAFRSCKSLESITISNGVTSIGEYAFQDCTSLESITIPDSITSIGGYAFNNTAYFNNKDNWEEGVLYIGNHLIKTGINVIGDYVVKDGTKTIAVSAFEACEGLTSVTIPDSVTSIGGYAFRDCESLTSVTIPDGVTSIGEYAFEVCRKLTSVTIPNSVTSIGEYAFRGCESLTSVTIPDGVTSIGECAFQGCTSLESITIPDSVMSIGECAFQGCTSLKSATVSDSVTSIGDSTFRDCTSLESITIPDSVMSIGECAFQGCTTLRAVTLPDSVTGIGTGAFEGTAYYNNAYKWENDVLYIGNHLIEARESISGDYVIKDGTKTIAVSAFEACEGLTSVTIPNGVTSIGDRTFYGCTRLESITLPDGVTSIGDSAFYICYELASITLPDSVTSIGGSTFYDCTSLESITLPDGVTSIGAEAFGGTGYYIYFLNWENDVLYIGNHLIKAGINVIGDYVVKDGTKTIADSAFGACTKLESITIPDSVTSIGERAFNSCTSLATINISECVEGISRDVFLDTAYYNNEYNWEKGVLYIGNHLIKAKDTVSGDYVVKDGTKTIADYAFSGCSRINTVTIGNRVTNIGKNAFLNSPNVTMCCYIGSYAQTFAEKNGIKYSLLELIPGDKTFISSLSKRIFTEQSGKNTVEEIVTAENYSIVAVPSFVIDNKNWYGTGSLIVFFKNGSLEFTYKLVVYGDLNGDSTVDVLDVAIAEKVASRTLSLDGDFFLAADFDSSGDVSVTDYQQIVNSALS